MGIGVLLPCFLFLSYSMTDTALLYQRRGVLSGVAEAGSLGAGWVTTAGGGWWTSRGNVERAISLTIS